MCPHANCPHRMPEPVNCLRHSCLYSDHFLRSAWTSVRCPPWWERVVYRLASLIGR